jgi:type II secretion system protein N
MPEKTTIVRRLLFALYFIAAFFLFLVLLFPYDRIKSKVETEVGSRTPYVLSIAHVSPRFINSFTLNDVVLSDQKGQVLFESPAIKASVSLFDLLRARLGIDLRAAAYGGELRADLHDKTGQRAIKASANNLDIGSYRLLKTFGVKLTGKLNGNLDLSGDTGKINLLITGLTSRELNVKGFPIPDLDFDQCWIEADIKGDRLTFKRFEMDGKEVKLRLQGDLVMNARGTLNLTVKLKTSERIAQQQAGLLSFLKNKDAEGFYQFGLGGTLEAPMPRL